MRNQMIQYVDASIFDWVDDIEDYEAYLRYLNDYPFKHFYYHFKNCQALDWVDTPEECTQYKYETRVSYPYTTIKVIHPITARMIKVPRYVYSYLNGVGDWDKGITKTPPGMVIHHINGNKEDDSFENLILLSRSQHGRVHTLGLSSREEIEQDIAKVADWKIKQKEYEDTYYTDGVFDKSKYRLVLIKEGKWTCRLMYNLEALIRKAELRIKLEQVEAERLLRPAYDVTKLFE